MSRLVEGRAGVADRIKVSVADYAVASQGVLTTSGLGSCLGVVIYDGDGGPGGLVHPMLPYRNDDTRPPEQFVDSGIEVVVGELLASGATERTLEAKLTGGAAVVDFASDGETIGDRNVTAARETLAEYGIEIVAEAVGGGRGRTVHADAETGVVTVRRTDGEEREL